jgi:hypothetical protein
VTAESRVALLPEGIECLAHIVGLKGEDLITVFEVDRCVER